MDDIKIYLNTKTQNCCGYLFYLFPICFFFLYMNIRRTRFRLVFLQNTTANPYAFTSIISKDSISYTTTLNITIFLSLPKSFKAHPTYFSINCTILEVDSTLTQARNANLYQILILQKSKIIRLILVFTLCTRATIHKYSNNLLNFSLKFLQKPCYNAYKHNSLHDKFIMMTTKVSSI